jgi:hypothetical protein
MDRDQAESLGSKLFIWSIAPESRELTGGNNNECEIPVVQGVWE